MRAAAWIMVLVILSWAVIACIVEHETKKRYRLGRYHTRPDERDSRLYWTRTWRT